MEIREGERHYGEYKRLVASDDRQLLRLIKSYERNAEEHRQKILNPHKYYGEAWELMRDRHKKRVMAKWSKEVDIFEEQAAIAKAIARGRGLDG